MLISQKADVQLSTIICVTVQVSRDSSVLTIPVACVCADLEGENF